MKNLGNYPTIFEIGAEKSLMSYYINSTIKSAITEKGNFIIVNNPILDVKQISDTLEMNKYVIHDCNKIENIKEIETSKPYAGFISAPKNNQAEIVGEVYNKFINEANVGKLNKTYIFIYIDDLPNIKNLSTFVTISRSRNIYPVMFISTKTNFEKKYGKIDAQTILKNSELVSNGSKL